MYFLEDDTKRVDYVLVYQDVADKSKVTKREHFQQNVDDAGLDIEIRDKSVC